MKVISAAEVEKHLPMPVAIGLVARAMIAVSRGQTRLPLRTAMEIDGTNKLGIMPGVLEDPAVYGVKLISLFPGNPAKGLSSHIGAMMLFDSQTGAPTAMVDADALTAIRTAAASAVATRELSKPESSVLALIGTGEQARSHIEAIRHVRPLADIRIAGRTAERAVQFVEKIASLYPDLGFIACNSAQEAVAGADIICTVTSSSTPVLHGEWVAAGSHVNAVGASIPTMQEIDEALLLKSRLFTDYRASALAQAREIIEAITAGTLNEADIRGEIGEVLDGQVRGRQTPEEITLYRSLGVAAQDLICADYLQRAL